MNTFIYTFMYLFFFSLSFFFVEILKVGCTHLDMSFFHSQLIDFDPKTHFVQFYLKIASYLLSRGKNKNMILGMRLLGKYIRKLKLVYVYPKWVHF